MTAGAKRRASRKASGPLQRREDRARAVESAAVAANPWQVRNGAAVAGEWVDPDDNDPNRRTARRISGHCAYDPVRRLKEMGTLSRSQVSAVMRLRKHYELGVLQQSGATDWSATPSGCSPGVGPAERVMQHIEAFDAARQHIGRNFAVVQAVCLDGQPIGVFAAAWKHNGQLATGMLLAGVSALQDWWERCDGPARRQEGEARA